MLAPMDIPLVLSADAEGRLVYGIPLWYRLMLGAILAVVAASVVTSGGEPGLGSWIIFAVLLVGILYEERWIADPATKRLRHVSGLLVIPRSRDIPFETIDSFGLSAVVRGTIPGGEDERIENDAAFALMNGETDLRGPKHLDRLFRKKAYMNLVVRKADGMVSLMNAVPAGRGASLREVGRRFAGTCGAAFVEMRGPA